MDKYVVLHDLKKIVNTMKVLARRLPEDKKIELKLLAQHLDKLYRDIDIKFNHGEVL